MVNPLKQVYTGQEKLVLGIDIGTTCSAVSICHLKPNTVPAIRTVSSWPDAPTESKLPSLVLLGPSNKPIAFGAECLTPAMKLLAAQPGYNLVKWFKLHLHPRSMQFESSATLVSSLEHLSLGSAPPPPIVPDFEVPSLPPGVTIGQVYSSFLRYLVGAARSWFVDHTPQGGEQIWDCLIGSADIIFATPDGWADEEQMLIRRVMREAGVMAEIEFLREAEACVHFSLQESQEWLKSGSIFTVADLGGSTCDVGMYRCDQVSPTIQLKEVKPSDSVQSGGVFVDRAAEVLINAKLSGSTRHTPQNVETIVAQFEADGKRRFTGTEQLPIFIKCAQLGNAIDRQHGVSRGRFALTEDEMESSFAVCVNEILSAVKQQIRMGADKSSHVIITGGFGESPYLRGRLRSFLEPSGFNVIASTEPSKKAVAEGCVLWHLSQLVVARAVRSTYGVSMAKKYNPSTPGHLGRPLHRWPDGLDYVYGAWSPIVTKGTILRTSAFFSRSYFRQPTHAGHLASFQSKIVVYDGDDCAPRWCRDRHDILLPGFSRRAEVHADLSPLRSILTPIKKGTTSEPATQNDIDEGRVYWHVDFEISIFVAETSLKAQLVWYEKGVRREGPATIVFADSPDRRDGPQIRRRLPADIVAQNA